MIRKDYSFTVYCYKCESFKNSTYNGWYVNWVLCTCSIFHPRCSSKAVVRFAQKLVARDTRVLESVCEMQASCSHCDHCRTRERLAAPLGRLRAWRAACQLASSRHRDRAFRPGLKGRGREWGAPGALWGRLPGATCEDLTKWRTPTKKKQSRMFNIRLQIAWLFIKKLAR